MRAQRIAKLLFAAALVAATARAEDGDPGDPHGGDPHGAQDDMFQPPEDGSVEDAKVAPGTILVQILDASGKAMPGTDVTLGIVYNSVAKGESRKRVVGKTGPTGHAKFEGLDTGTGVAYRAMVLSDGATFAMPPVQLPAKAGVRGVLHVYPVERDLDKTLVVTQSLTYAEVKDDRVQIEQTYKLYNFGKNAWVPEGIVLSLPSDHTAFTAQQGMTDVGVDAVPGKGARLRGTFAPGEHVVSFRWQLPYAGGAEVQFDAGMTPRLASSLVLSPASKAVRLDVEGFPAAVVTQDGAGQRTLRTERTLRREESPLKAIRVRISGLPSEGPGKLYASFLSGAGVVLGLVLGSRRPPRRDTKAERARLLADLEALERAKAADELGPKTYERARRELVDELARTFAEDAAGAPGEGPSGAPAGRKRAKKPPVA